MIPANVFQHTIETFLAPIASYLADSTVTEILINGPQEVFVEHRGKLEQTSAHFDSHDKLLSAIRLIAQHIGRAFDNEHPILEGRLPDGSRVEALLPPLAAGGVTVAIRRFSKDRLTLNKLLELNSLTPDAITLLRTLVECKQNIIVAGGTGSGKTSMLNALSALIPDDERIIVIEDARELQLQKSHVVQLEVRTPDARGKNGVSIRDLFKASLRMRPDRIILGEIRGGEALDLIQAMTSGHGGSLSTVHATYPTDTLNRLETLALMGGVELPLSALRAQLASAIDIVIQTGRLRDGSRRVTHISEVCTANERGYIIHDLFTLHSDTPNGPLLLTPTGLIPSCIELIRAHGFELPDSIRQAARRNAVDS